MAEIANGVGVIVTAGALGFEDVPVPLSATLCGLSEALSAICNVACRTPTALGVNVIPSMQLAFAATAAVHVLVDTAKSPAFAPATVVAVMFNAAVPSFVTVNTTGALAVFCTVFGNNTGPAGVIVTAGPACAVPVPVSARVCGLSDASSAICKFA